MRISDWSSDVCSSDLLRQYLELAAFACAGEPARCWPGHDSRRLVLRPLVPQHQWGFIMRGESRLYIGWINGSILAWRQGAKGFAHKRNRLFGPDVTKARPRVGTGRSVSEMLGSGGRRIQNK